MSYMVLLLGQSDKIIRGRTGPTCEPDAQLIATTQFQSKGIGGTRGSLWALAQTSLSLSTASPTSCLASAGARIQGGLHRKTSSQFNPEGSAASSRAGRFHQSLGGAGFAAEAGPRQRPWLSANANENYVAKFTFCRIVMCHKKYLKSIADWCRCRSQPWLSLRRS
jgi:hypothetical protein